MGKVTKTKQQELAANEAKLQATFAANSAKAKCVPEPVPLVDEFAAYATHFVRSPDAFVLKTRSAHRAKQVREMARYLFGVYRIPRILEQAWEAYLKPSRTLLNEGGYPYGVARQQVDRERDAQARANNNLSRIDFRTWYIAVATGKSLYKDITKGYLTKRETHFFQACAHQLTLLQALVYAVARGQGGTEGVSLRLARSKFATLNLNDPFWFDVVRFFAQEGHTPVSVQAVDDLIDFLRHQHHADRTFRIFGAGHSLASLERRMVQWHYALRRTKLLGNAHWEGCGLPDHTITLRNDGQDVVWEFHQIVSSVELAAEGTAMRHCVLSYKDRCVSGQVSIWSLRQRGVLDDFVRKVTIELTNDGRIVQKRGLANRSVRSDENHVIGLWSREFNLSNGY